MDGRTDGRMDRWTDGHTDGKSPHSTGLRPLSGPLPCLPHENQGEEQGKGTADHLMPLGYLLLLRIRNLKIPEVAPISDWPRFKMIPSCINDQLDKAVWDVVGWGVAIDFSSTSYKTIPSAEIGTVTRGGSGQWGLIGTPGLSRNRPFVSVSLPATGPCPDSPPLSRSTLSHVSKCGARFH